MSFFCSERDLYVTNFEVAFESIKKFCEVATTANYIVLAMSKNFHY